MSPNGSPLQVHEYVKQWPARAAVPRDATGGHRSRCRTHRLRGHFRKADPSSHLHNYRNHLENLDRNEDRAFENQCFDKCTRESLSLLRNGSHSQNEFLHVSKPPDRIGAELAVGAPNPHMPWR
jgi:hypothetical protein